MMIQMLPKIFKKSAAFLRLGILAICVLLPLFSVLKAMEGESDEQATVSYRSLTSGAGGTSATKAASGVSASSVELGEMVAGNSARVQLPKDDQGMAQPPGPPRPNKEQLSCVQNINCSRKKICCCFGSVCCAGCIWACVAYWRWDTAKCAELAKVCSVESITPIICDYTDVCEYEGNIAACEQTLNASIPGIKSNCAVGSSSTRKKRALKKPKREG